MVLAGVEAVMAVGTRQVGAEDVVGTGHLLEVGQPRMPQRSLWQSSVCWVVD